MFSPKSASQKKEVDTKRRNLIKIGLFGVGAFALGKVLGPSLDFFSKDMTVEKDGEKTTFFNNFRVKENGAELGIYDDLGNEILVIEKD